MHHKLLVKQEQVNPKSSRWREVTKIGTDASEVAVGPEYQL
jgi:hypothetical protein